MKHLIINADDYGYTKSINKGIQTGISNGVITSTSLMVYGEYAKEVANISDIESISIGLHFEVPRNKKEVEKEFFKQVDLFMKLVGREPDHIDSHKILPKDIEQLGDTLESYSKESKTPIRRWGHAKLIEEFFGLNLDGSGELDIKRLSIDSLIKILDDQLVERYNEMMCHAGFVDDDLMEKSSYNKPRELELETLLSEQFSEYLGNREDVELVSWREVGVVLRDWVVGWV